MGDSLSVVVVVVLFCGMIPFRLRREPLSIYLNRTFFCVGRAQAPHFLAADCLLYCPVSALRTHFTRRVCLQEKPIDPAITLLFLQDNALLGHPTNLQ